MNKRRLLILGSAAGMFGMSEPANAKFTGKLVVSFDPEGRVVTLIQPYGYIGPDGVKWDVPAGARVDGASIPRPFWPIIGGPFEGKYRNASVIHDWYCDRRNRPWRRVHRAFYDAMRESQVNESIAKIMYQAVMKFGPKWSDVVVSNNTLKASISSLSGMDPRRYSVMARAVSAAIESLNGPRAEAAILVQPSLESGLAQSPTGMATGTATDQRYTIVVSVKGLGDAQSAELMVLERQEPTAEDVARTIKEAPTMSVQVIEQAN